ncbi:MAG: hypothetical protein IKZ98_05615 [Clostridia bacterium]|nr:hypothetical protein [Clostridia bacterium]
MKKTICVVLGLLLIVSMMCAAFAAETVITYPKDRTNSWYGPAKYFKKTNANNTWSIRYTAKNRPNQDEDVLVYLYDRNTQAQSTDKQYVYFGRGTTTMQYLPGRNHKNDQYKIVMGLRRPPDGGTYRFVWEP